LPTNYWAYNAGLVTTRKLHFANINNRNSDLYWYWYRVCASLLSSKVTFRKSPRYESDVYLLSKRREGSLLPRNIGRMVKKISSFFISFLSLSMKRR